MGTHDAVVDAAGITAVLAPSEGCIRMLSGTLKRFGATLSARLAPHDVGQLLVPVGIITDGVGRVGCLLAVDDRALLAWSAPSAADADGCEVIAYASVRSARLVRTAMRPAGLVVEAGQSWSLVLPESLGQEVPALLADLLRGSWAPNPVG